MCSPPFDKNCLLVHLAVDFGTSSVVAISHENLRDQQKFEPYRKRVMPTLGPFEGKCLVRGGRFTVIEGAWAFERTVVVEFPSRAKAEAWYNTALTICLPHRLDLAEKAARQGATYARQDTTLPADVPVRMMRLL